MRHPAYEEARAMLLNGARIKDVKVLGVGIKTICRWRKDLGLARHRRYVDRVRIVSRLLDGLTPGEVAQELGCLRGDVHRYAMLAGIRQVAKQYPKATALLEFLREPGAYADVRDIWINSLRRRLEVTP